MALFNYMIMENTDNKIKPSDIDWDAYSKELEASIDNEDIWAAGYIPSSAYDTYNPHIANAVVMRKELEMIKHGQYGKVLALHEAEIWKDWLKK